jgi:hypothetical protein
MAAASVLKLTIDRQNLQLVAGGGAVQAGVLSIPGLFQSNTLTLRIQIVDPTGDFTAPYSIVDLNGIGLRASVGDTPTGAAGGPAPLALQDTFVWDAVNKWFSADIALNTAAIDAFLGSAAAKTAYFEINLTGGANRTTILQATFTLKAVVDELGSTVPAPTDQYLTKAESVALFAKRVNDPGVRIVLVSPSGTYGRELGVDDAGNAIDNVFPI